MDKHKRERIEAAGFKVGSVADFLGLTAEESEMIELRLALSRSLRQSRIEHQLSQAELARRLGSSQSRVAKIEAGDPSVSIDLMIRALFAMGTTRQELSAIIASPAQAA